MDYPHDKVVWERMVARQITNLKKIPGVTIDDHRYIPDPAPYRIYQHEGPNGTTGYSLPGYQLIQLQINVPAIMDCRASTVQKVAHNLSSTRQVQVSSNHTIQLLMPRTFNLDPIGWGIRFISEPPMYPNIVCATLDNNNMSLLKFSQRAHQMAELLPGLVCIGASQDRSNPTLPYVLISDLKNYLDLSDPARWKGVGRGGVNDYGFEKNLFDHMSQNYAILRKAIEEHSAGQHLNPHIQRRKLGGDRSERRKLGK